MNHILRKLIFSLALTVAISPVYAADESSTNSNASTASKDNKSTPTDTSATAKSTNITDNTNSQSSTSSSKNTLDKAIKKKAKNSAKAAFKNITVNLNNADAKTFSHYLMGIGPAKAKNIIDYRKKNGKFKDIADLKEVAGIGPNIFDGIKNNVSLTKGETSAPITTKTSKKTANKLDNEKTDDKK